MPKSQKIPLTDSRGIAKKIAESQSLYSDVEPRIIKISANLSSARNALGYIYIALHYEYWETEDLIRSIGQKAYLQNYNGKWKTVQEFLESEFQTPKDFEDKFISVFGPHDFFGNFLPAVEKQYRLLKVTDLTKEKTGKVNYPQFHRGYKDKGSLRLPHEYHGDRPVGPERLDRRQNIKHPLLGENFLQVEDGVQETLPRKE